MARRIKTRGEGIAARFRKAQKAADLSVREAAEYCHVSAATITRIRSGGGGGMSVDLLVDVARGVKVNPIWLLFGEGEGPDAKPAPTKATTKPPRGRSRD